MLDFCKKITFLTWGNKITAEIHACMISSGRRAVVKVGFSAIGGLEDRVP